ncbi:alpha/beta fold hydrolase [Candidatus Nomurabacteria bacterium]|nr:alpha/beta fold hydrolase [Candidatus Nomurabacteria bacterium]
MADQIIQIDVPNNATDIVIFVHGFGVRYDSRGMFTDIKAGLPNNFGTVLFDLNNFSGNDVYLATIKDQAMVLQKIFKQVTIKYPKKTVHIIAHSMGCIVASIAKLSVDGNVILLTPPDNFGGDHLESYFRNYKGAVQKGKILTVPRKDGTISHIPVSFFKELAEIDPIGSILDYAQTKILHIIQTTRDELIGTTDYSKLSKLTNITKVSSDHNFTGENRDNLIKTISDILKK